MWKGKGIEHKPCKKGGIYMKEETLVQIEFAGRTIISIVTIFIIFSITNIWITLLPTILMILWVLNPIIEYQKYGG